MASKQEYLNMMKRMDKMDPDSVIRDGEVNSARPAGMMGGTPDMLNSMKNLDPKRVVREGEMNAVRGAMGAGMTGNILEEMKKLDPKGVVREDEMMKMLGDLTMSDREAIEGLTSMGITLEDALEAILGVSEADTMPEGALGSLPTRDTNSVVRENENMFDADRTQSLDMQKEAMGT